MTERLLLFGVVLFVAGCGAASDSPPAEFPSKVSAAPDTNAPPATATVSELESPEAASNRTADFQPPFPHRTNLFEPPHGSKTTVRRDDEQGESIELKGFIDVNGPQVVLAIDGVLLPIPEGGEKYGVQVISINPPQAVLQRGRNRWTASLE